MNPVSYVIAQVAAQLLLVQCRSALTLLHDVNDFCIVELSSHHTYARAAQEAASALAARNIQ
jgi:hypothetical protein